MESLGSWTPHSPTRGMAQAAAQVQVAEAAQVQVAEAAQVAVAEAAQVAAAAARADRGAATVPLALAMSLLMICVLELVTKAAVTFVDQL